MSGRWYGYFYYDPEHGSARRFHLRSDSGTDDSEITFACGLRIYHSYAEPASAPTDAERCTTCHEAQAAGSDRAA